MYITKRIVEEFGFKVVMDVEEVIWDRIIEPENTAEQADFTWECSKSH